MYHVDIMQDGSILYKEGDKVALDGTSWKGTVVKVESDDNISVELQYVFQKEEKEVRIEKKNITKANITTNSQYFIWYQFWG